MAAQISPPMWAHCQAMDSRVEQGAQGFSPAQANPLAVAAPIRRPVKEPGPAATAITSTSSTASPQFFSRSFTMGSRVRLWVRPLHWKDWASSAPSRHRAAEQAVADDSRARIFILPPPRRQ